MTPVIQHLRNKFPQLPMPLQADSLHWNFDSEIKNLGAVFYRELVLFHPILMLEYSVTCSQLADKLSNSKPISRQQITKDLEAALLLAQLMEHLHKAYLNVPREVLRLRRHQVIYKELLEKIAGYSFNVSPMIEEDLALEVGLSLSQYIRDTTAFANPFRLFVTRGKRFLNFLNLVVTSSVLLKDFMELFDKFGNPVLAYVSWLFFIPRLATNLFLLIKHLAPGSWMSEEEQSLGWWVRLQVQLQRRWFELFNDKLWFTLGILSCFVLIGTLAPTGAYFAVAAFALDIAYASIRALIELKRTYQAQTDYTKMYNQACTDGNHEKAQEIQDYQIFLAKRIKFEQMRLGLSVATTVGIFLAMCLAIPVLAVNPIFPLVGAALLMVIWIANYILTQKLENYRPNDAIAMPTNLTKFGIFTPKPEPPASNTTEADLTSSSNSLPASV